MGNLVLVVDDVPDVRQYLVSVLKMGDFRVVTADDGAEAVRQAIKHMPDLVLMDIHMPKMSGYEAARFLRSLPGVQDIPIVFLSVLSTRGHMERSREIGAVRHVTKPISPDTLLQVVRDTFISRAAAV